MTYAINYVIISYSGDKLVSQNVQKRHRLCHFTTKPKFAICIYGHYRAIAASKLKVKGETRMNEIMVEIRGRYYWRQKHNIEFSKKLTSEGTWFKFQKKVTNHIGSEYASTYRRK